MYNTFYLMFYGHINVNNHIKVYIFLIKIKWKMKTIKKIRFFDRKTVDLPLIKEPVRIKISDINKIHYIYS